jgi:zinc D-Ala-D-Ala dipeptidase
MSFLLSIPNTGTPSWKTAAAAEQLRAYLMDAPPACLAEWTEKRCRQVVPVPQGLVDIRSAAPEVMVLPAPAWSDPELRHLVRPEVAERLRQAAGVLPSDVRLGFWEGLRPVAIQRMLWETGLSFLRTSYPHSTGQELEGMLEHYVARPDGKRPPHSTGTAVDVAAVDAFGQVLNPNDPWGKLGTRILAQALRETGLANYEPEWWHWSYGDEEWARAYDCAPLSLDPEPLLDSPGEGI